MFIVKEPLKFSDEIQDLMKQNAGIVREETKLKNGFERNFGIKEQVLF